MRGYLSPRPPAATPPPASHIFSKAMQRRIKPSPGAGRKPVSRRWTLGVPLFVLVLVAIGFKLAEDGGERRREMQRSQAARDASRPALDAVTRPDVSPPVEEPVGDAETTRLVVMDVADDAPVAGLPLVARSDSRIRRVRTDASGVVRLAGEREFQLEMVETSTRRLARPAARYPGRESVVWTYETVEIQGTVTLEAPGPDPPAPVVVAAPVQRPGGNWVSKSRPGTIVWFDANADNRGVHRAEVDGKNWSVKVPSRLGRIGVLGYARGYAFVSDEVTAQDGRARSVHLYLKRRPVSQIHVADSSGDPLEGASVQYQITRRGTRHDVNPHWGYLYRAVTGAPYVAGTDSDGAYESMTTTGTTGADGGVRLRGALVGNHYEIVVRAQGFRKHVSGGIRPLGDLRISLEETRVPRERYRFFYNGELIENGVLYLCERGASGLHSALPPVVCDEAGWFPSGVAERGVEYVAIIQDYDGRGGTLRGGVKLGDLADVVLTKR